MLLAAMIMSHKSAHCESSEWPARKLNTEQGFALGLRVTTSQQRQQARCRIQSGRRERAKVERALLYLAAYSGKQSIYYNAQRPHRQMVRGHL